MEPFSALSVATAACQFLDFTANIVSGTWRIYWSEPHDNRRNSHIRTITEDLTRLNDEIRRSMRSSSAQPPTQREAAILTLGKGPQAQGGRKYWDSFVTALRSEWDAKKIDTLTQDLESYRQQITMQLVVSQSELHTASNADHSETLNKNIDLSRIILDKVENFEMSIFTAINKSYGYGSSGIMAKTPSDTLEEVLRNTDTTSVNYQVLHRLRFKDIQHRYARVAPAHEKTFEWLFLPPAEPAQWANFGDWLRDDVRSLYWITGKPGAGKSTLMKFIVEHPGKNSLLKQWVGNQGFLAANFYFWNSGTRLQKSYEGLARSLLYQLLGQAPHLVPVALPHRVMDGLFFGQYIFVKDTWTWTWEELLNAFRMFIREATTSGNYKILLFIDGTDEFEGKPKELIDFIKTLEVPGVKVCASSRPWNQFQDAFGNNPHLRIEQLTFGDIQQFVSSTLNKSSAFQDYDQSDPGYSAQLIRDVCEKSKGVFLWVYRVAHSLLEGISDGEKPSELRDRLESLPADLEETERASELLQLHREFPLPSMTLLDMSFADQDRADLAFQTPSGPLDREQSNAIAKLTRRRINACMKGLLEANSRDVTDAADARIELLHRTVKDYLARSDIWKRICAISSKSFSLEVGLFNCFAMRLKTQQVGHELGHYFADVSYATNYVRKAKLDEQRRQELLASLDRLYADLAITTASGSTTTPFSQTAAGTWATVSWAHVDDDYVKKLVAVAAYCGHLTYPDQGLKALPDESREKFVCHCLFLVTKNTNFTRLNQRFHLKYWTPFPELIRLLLELGGDPSYVPERQTKSVTDLILEMILRNDDPDYLTILEEFVLHGADFSGGRLDKFINRTKFNTTSLETAMKQKKNERTLKGRGSRLLARLGSKRRNAQP